MLYQMYQMQDDLIAPLRTFARHVRIGGWPLLPLRDREMSVFDATMEMISRYRLSHKRPPFAIQPVRVGNRVVPVREEVRLRLPFGNLLQLGQSRSALTCNKRNCRQAQNFRTKTVNAFF